MTDEPDRARDLVDLILRAFEDSSFFALLRALKDADKTERDEVLRLITELDVFETVKMAEVVRARVGVIRKFREMIETDAPEKPDMQDFLFKHRYLVVEVKRPHKTIGRAEVQQTIDYVEYLRDHAATSGQSRRPNLFEGVLVGHHLSEPGKRWAQVAARSDVTVRRWDELLDVAERIHGVFLEAMKTRAPEDARVQGILAEQDEDQGS